MPPPPPIQSSSALAVVRLSHTYNNGFHQLLINQTFTVLHHHNCQRPPNILPQIEGTSLCLYRFSKLSLHHLKWNLQYLKRSLKPSVLFIQSCIKLNNFQFIGMKSKFPVLTLIGVSHPLLFRYFSRAFLAYKVFKQAWYRDESVTSTANQTAPRLRECF